MLNLKGSREDGSLSDRTIPVEGFDGMLLSGNFLKVPQPLPQLQLCPVLLDKSTAHLRGMLGAQTVRTIRPYCPDPSQSQSL